MKLRDNIKNGRQILVAFLAVVLISGFYTATDAFSGSDEEYDSLNPAKVIIKKGPAGSFDHLATHTLSIVELNKNGYRFWGYYTGWNGNGMQTNMGLAYSNDLVNWVKDDSSPVVRDLRWGTVIMVDGVINMFGTRNYGGYSYIVRLTSEDGKNFTEQEMAVAPVNGEKNQNPFIFYDEENQVYRLYYFHLIGKNNRIEEKHSADITQLAVAPENLVMSDRTSILAAPSIFYRDGKYWFFTETCRKVNDVFKWQTLAFVSDNPIMDFEPTEIDKVLIDNDACFMPYLFDNQFNGVFSHKYPDGTWELFRTTYDFNRKNQIYLGEPSTSLSINETKQLAASFILSGGNVQNISAAASWATSDNSIVTIQKGLITAKKEGTAIITVSFGGVSTTEEIYVVKPKSIE